MINKKHKPGIQTDLEDLIIFAENDQAFANAIEIDKKQALPEPLASYNEKIQKLIVTVMREEKVQHTKKKNCRP